MAYQAYLEAGISLGKALSHYPLGISAGEMSRSCNSPTAIFILLDKACLGVITGSTGYLFETSDWILTEKVLSKLWHLQTVAERSLRMSSLAWIIRNTTQEKFCDVLPMDIVLKFFYNKYWTVALWTSNSPKQVNPRLDFRRTETEFRRRFITTRVFYGAIEQCFFSVSAFLSFFVLCSPIGPSLLLKPWFIFISCLKKELKALLY